MKIKNIPFEKSFASHEKSKYWYPLKNGKLTPNNVTLGSAIKCWFICENCDHEFQNDPNHITAKNKPTWCPYCCIPPKNLCENNNCKKCYEKSFQSYLDKKECNVLWLMVQKEIPRFVFKSSNSYYFLICKKCNHCYQSKLGNITILGRDCPFCTHKKLCDYKYCDMCQQNSFESHIKSLYWDNQKNCGVTPRDIFKNSSKKYWFICECGHSFDASLTHISSEKEPRWCPYCNGTNQKALECFERTFASHPLSLKWDNQKNGDIQPKDVFKGSSEKYWFICECGHSFDTSLSNITKENNSWCPYCCIPPKKLCKNNDDKHCISCFEKSFASHPKKICFDNLNNIDSCLVFKGSPQKYWFKCDTCDHTFYQQMNLICTGTWCHYCSGHILCENDECKKCFEKSFASHDKINFLDKSKEQPIPRTIHKSSNIRLWFLCENKHSFEVFLPNLTKRKGRPSSWCPYCINKTEQKLYDKLNNIYPMLERQYKVNWCKSKSFLPFDFVIKQYKIIIELDGPQHFRIINDKWRTPEEEQQNDIFKMECANKNGFSVIRILQEDVFYDTYNWLEELVNNINYIKNLNYIENIFMSKDDRYDIHKKSMELFNSLLLDIF